MNHIDFFKRFPTENDAIDFIVATKYKIGYYCPKCGCFHKGIYHQHYNHRNLYCNNCQNEFSALTGTIFEHTHLDLRMWLFALNLVLIARKGISGLQLQRELGMKSYKGAFRMLNLIRKAMGTETHKDTFDAIVEIDETYVGGKPRKENKHNGKTKKSKRGRGADKNFYHIKVDHSAVYSLGDGKHTNTIESCWAILKRGVYGIYHHVSVKHLQEYVDEFCYRLNHRETEQALEHLLGLGIYGVAA